MNNRAIFIRASAAAMSLGLAACGSGGDSAPVVSVPSPPPAPTPTPTPTPTPVISDLKEDQSFDVVTGNQVAQFDLKSGNTLASRSTTSGVQIAYDASADRYTLTSDDGRTASFSPADSIATDDPDLVRFQTKSGSNSDFLTLAYSGYGSALKTDSVALGFWQSNRSSSGLQDTDFDVFVYGFPSATSAIPTTGSADFRTDVFGFSSQVGSEPVSFQGTGVTTFDFARSTFEMDTNLSETFLVSGGGRFGALYLRASGRISSMSNAFDGTFRYEGSNNPVSGLLSGSFYGRNAQEAGGTFSGDDGAGNSVVGGFTALSNGQSHQNLSIYNLRTDELFYTARAGFERRQNKDGSPGFSLGRISGNGQVIYTESEKSYRVSGFVDSEGLFKPSDIVSPAQSQFTVYRINAGTEDIELALYQPANGGQVALTYSGFGVYRRTFENSTLINVKHDWFQYGLDTLEGVLNARTGTGTYNGVVRGTAGSNGGLRQLDVTGTSQFVIDFASQGYTGLLRLQGRDTASSSNIDFGQFDLTPGNGLYRNAFATALQQGGNDVGEIQLRFYGPTGEELAGVFGITTDDFAIAGATAAQRR